MKDLEGLRREIDGINDEMVNLLLRRLQISKEIAEFKLENHMEILDSSREKQIVNRMLENKEEKYHPYIKMFMKELMGLSKEIQKEYIDGYEK